jgi:hypothetical protein
MFSYLTIHTDNNNVNAWLLEINRRKHIGKVNMYVNKLVRDQHEKYIQRLNQKKRTKG